MMLEVPEESQRATAAPNCFLQNLSDMLSLNLSVLNFIFVWVAFSVSLSSQCCAYSLVKTIWL